MLLWCFNYDPQTGRYTLAVLRTLKLAGVLCLLAIAVGMLVMNAATTRRHGR